MDIFKEIAPLKEYLQDRKKEGKTIGLVPTMGALHKGHMALIESSISENDVTISTIFVNPTQFNNKQDLEKYPKTFDADIEQLNRAGCDVVFSPKSDEVYPDEPVLSLDFGTLANEMEGKFRPGHFSGVGLVVAKLFNIVDPDRAYFGQKDLQQFFIIKQLVNDLSFDVKLRCVPIVREDSGLAMSSRNMRLSDKGREDASSLYQELNKASAALQNGVSFEPLKSEIRSSLIKKSIDLEYFEMVNADSLELINDYNSTSDTALCLAAFVEGVRLIDNIIINRSE